MAWLFALLWPLLRYPPAIERREIGNAVTRRATVTLVTVGALTALAILPLALHGLQLAQRGEYVAPRHMWRSGPPGVDIATFFLGNPFHPLWGSAVTQIYRARAIDPVESAGWLGIVPVIALGVALRRHRFERDVRLWIIIGAVALMWSLGPWLLVAGTNTGLMLPQNPLSLIPILSNARMPGRGLIVVSLALSVITALVISRHSRLSEPGALFVIGLLLVADTVPAPFPIANAGVSPIYQELARQPAGAVCELPLGLHDGLGQVGIFDMRVLVAQTVHRHPILGGAAARIPASLATRYEQLPVIRSLLALSSGHPADPADLALSTTDAGRTLVASDIRFVVLDRSLAPPPLVEYAETALPLRRLASDGTRELFAIEAR
jgi:hypothetical protein